MHELPQAVARAGGRVSAVAPRARGPLCGALLAVLAAAVPAAALPGGGGVRLDGVPVPSAEVWTEYNFLTKSREIIHPKTYAGINRQVFDTAVQQVVNRNLLAREAVRVGVTLSPEEKAAVRAVQVKAWKSEGNFLTAMAMLGIDETAFLHRMELNQLARKAAERAVEAHGAATEEELRAYYRDNPRRYLDAAPPLRYLLLRGTWRQPQLKEIYSEVEGLRKAGKSYESLVRGRSIHESAAGGGLVGEGGAVAAGLPHPELARGLEPGRISQARIDTAGTHLYLCDINLPLPFEEVADRVRKEQREWRIAETMSAQLAALRATARIELLEGEPPPAPPAEGAGGHQRAPSADGGKGTPGGNHAR